MGQLYEGGKVFNFKLEGRKVNLLLGTLIFNFPSFVFTFENSLADNLNNLVLPSLWQRGSVCWYQLRWGGRGTTWGEGD